MSTNCGIGIATFNRSFKRNIAVFCVVWRSQWPKLYPGFVDDLTYWKSPPLFSCRFQNGTTFNISMGAVTPYYIKKKQSIQQLWPLLACCVVPKDVIIIPNYVDISKNLSPKSAHRSTVLPVGNARKVDWNLTKAITEFALPLYLVTFGLANWSSFWNFRNFLVLLILHFMSMKSLTMSGKCFIITKLKD